MIGDVIMIFFYLSIGIAAVSFISLIEWIICKIEKANEKRKQNKLEFEKLCETRARINRNTTFLNCLMDGLRQD